MAGLHFDITGDNSNFMDKLKQTENGIRQTSQKIEESGLGMEQMFGRIAKAAAGIGAAFSAQQFASQVMKVRGEFQQLEVAFTTMLGSAEKANDLMGQLTRTAAITPFGLQDVAGGAKSLLAYGVASEKVNETLIRLGDIAAGLSIPLNDLVYLYGTTMTQGRMFTQDLRQFQGRGIPLADELAKQFGVTKDKVGELVTAGKVGFAELEKAVVSMTSEGSKFGGLMEAQSKTITGQISNIEDAIDGMFNEIGKSSEGVINSALSGVSTLVENWEKVADAIGYAASAYGSYKAALMVTSAIDGVKTNIASNEEIEGLKNLLGIKEEVKNADLDAAVASGTLTQAKAQEMAMLRQEVAQRLAILKLKEEEAKAEAAAALDAFNIAKQEKEAADERLENMQNLYEAAIEQGDASYEAYVTDQLQTASANANTAATRLNTAERNLNSASSRANAASQATNTFATNANTIANNANTRSLGLMKAAALQLQTILKSMYATMMANPLAIVVAAVGALTYGIYKYATRASAAEKATKRLNDILEEQAKVHDENKKRIDDLVSTLGNLELSEGTRIANFQKLKQEYPEILKNINSENEFLKEKHNILQLINKEQAKEQQKDAQYQLRIEEQRLKRLEEHRAKYGDISLVDVDGNGWASDNVVEAINAQKDIVNQLKESVAQPVVDSYLESIKSLKNEDIASTLEEITNTLVAMQGAGDKAIGIVTSLGGEFSKSQLTSIKSALEGEQSSRGGEKNTAAQWLAKYKKEYEASEKALSDFRIKKDKMSEVEYERHLKELTDARDAAKKKYEDAGGSTKNNQKQIKAEEEKANELLKIERKNQQDRINLMKEGAEKERAQIELDYQKDLDAYEEVRKKYGDTDEVSKMRKNIDDKYQKAKADLEKQTLKDELQAMYYYLQEYGTIQQQKYAIAKQYDDMIAEERNQTRKKMLEQEKQAKLDTLNANNIAMGIDWGATFKGIGNVLGDIAKETLSKVEEYMKTDEFKNLSAENKKTYTDLRDKLRQETGEGATSPFNFKQWDKISKDVDDYKKAVETLKSAQIAHNEAVDRLKKAEEALANATDDTSKAIAQTAVDIATGDVDVTGAKQEEAEDNVTTSKNNLVQSTNEAAQGIENFASYLNEMNSGSLYGFANGITKLITSLTKGSDGVGKSLEQLGGKVGGIVGAILQIIEVLGDAPAQFIDELLKNVAVAVESILVELPQIVGSIVKGVGNIVSSIFTGIGSLFGFGSGDKKKEKRIKDYQRQIEELDKRYEELEKQVEGTYSNVAKKKIEEQNANLERQRALIVKQIQEEESKKKTDEGKIEEWREQLKEINEQIEENKEAAKDAIFGSDLQSAIEDFASAYTEAWSAGEDKAKSAKDVVRNMIKGMITESIKAAASDPMKAIREKLLQFWSDEYINAWEESQLNQAAEQLQKDLDEKFGWADRFMDDSSYSQEASSKGFETMSEETGSELNGRFTALQISNEEIKNQMIQSVVVMTQMLSISSHNNGLLNDILTQHAIANGYLADMVKYSKIMSGYGEKIDKIVENTQNM